MNDNKLAQCNSHDLYEMCVYEMLVKWNDYDKVYERSYVHSAWMYIDGRDHQYNQVNMYKKANGWQLGTLHFGHKFRDKDLCISDWCKQDEKDNQSSTRIRVYNPHMDFQSIRSDKYKHQLHFVLYKLRLCHKDLVNKGSWLRQGSLVALLHTDWMDPQSNRLNSNILVCDW